MLLTPMKPMVPPLLHLDQASALSLQHGGIPSPVLMPPTKRPKLSVQTASLSTTYGSTPSATGSRKENMSTATPTTLNTFSNTFDLSIRPSPNSTTASPNILQRNKSTCSTPLRRMVAYDLNLPLGVRSILKQSYLGTEHRRSSLTTSASPRSTRRVFFPPVKKVSFMPIDEEIVTHIYVARHIDLSSSEEESHSESGTDGKANQSVSNDNHEADESSLALDQHRAVDREGRGRANLRRLPSGHRSKRKRRRWEWTIENLNKGEGETLVEAQKSHELPVDLAELPELPPYDTEEAEAVQQTGSNELGVSTIVPPVLQHHGSQEPVPDLV